MFGEEESLYTEMKCCSNSKVKWKSTTFENEFLSHSKHNILAFVNRISRDEKLPDQYQASIVFGVHDGIWKSNWEPNKKAEEQIKLYQDTLQQTLRQYIQDTVHVPSKPGWVQLLIAAISVKVIVIHANADKHANVVATINEMVFLVVVTINFDQNADGLTGIYPVLSVHSVAKSEGIPVQIVKEK